MKKLIKLQEEQIKLQEAYIENIQELLPKTGEVNEDIKVKMEALDQLANDIDQIERDVKMAMKEYLHDNEKIKLETNADAEGLFEGLSSFKPIENTKLSYAIMRTKQKLGRYFNHLASNLPKITGFPEWEKARVALNEQFAVKDEAGKPKKIVEKSPQGEDRERYDIPTEVLRGEEFKKALDELKEKHSSYFNSEKERRGAVTKSRAEEFTGEIYYIDDSNLPSNLTEPQLTVLDPMIVEHGDSK